jgi:hypothetical protein
MTPACSKASLIAWVISGDSLRRLLSKSTTLEIETPGLLSQLRLMPASRVRRGIGPGSACSVSPTFILCVRQASNLNGAYTISVRRLMRLSRRRVRNIFKKSKPDRRTQNDNRCRDCCRTPANAALHHSHPSGRGHNIALPPAARPLIENVPCPYPAPVGMVARLRFQNARRTQKSPFPTLNWLTVLLRLRVPRTGAHQDRPSVLVCRPESRVRSLRHGQQILLLVLEQKEPLRVVGEVGKARTLIDLEHRTRRVRTTANVEAFSAALVSDLERAFFIVVGSEWFHPPQHRGAGLGAPKRQSHCWTGDQLAVLPSLRSRHFLSIKEEPAFAIRSNASFGPGRSHL